MSWAYYCESCKQLRGFTYKFKPKVCGKCGSKRIDVDVLGSPRLEKRRFGDGPKVAKYGAKIDVLADGSRIFHNFGSSTTTIKRADGSYVPVPPGEALALGPDDVVVQGDGPSPFAV